MIAAAERGKMLECKDVYYMKKLVTGAEGIGVCLSRSMVLVRMAG